MPSIPQITQVDPASFPDSKLDIGLPIISSVYGSVFNTGFSIGDIFYQNVDGIMMPDVDNAISKMSSNNFFILNGSTDLIFVGFKTGDGKNFFSFNVTEKLDFTFNYPKDLIVLAMEGNGNNLLGKRASLDGLGFDFTHWREYAIHWVHDVHHKFSYGARLKYLYGMENFTTDVSYMGIETDQNTHALKFDMAFDFRTSGLPQVMVDGDIPVIGGLNTNDSISMQQSGFSPGYINNYLFNRNNRGLGIDFGFNYHISDKLLLEASVLDLGFINWNSYTANSKLEAWDYEYDGISNPISIFGDGSSVGFLKDVLEDSIEEDLKNNYSYSNESYSTALRTKIYASMEYTVDHNNFVSLSLYSSFVRGVWRRGLGLAYNYHLGNFLSATASYSIYNRSYSNLGFGVSVNLGPVEIYCLTDNVLAFGTLNPRDNFLSSTASSINIDTKKVRNGQIHFGLNLTFGRDKKEKPVDEADQGRAKAVNSGSEEQNKESSAKDKISSNSGSSGETNTPKRTNYNSKGNSDKKQKTKKAKTSYNKKTEKKKNTRKGELKTKVEQSAPKSSTSRKISRKL